MGFDFTSNLNMEELRALDELKDRIGDELKEEDRKNDSLFLRFLRARDFNINKAEVMLRNHIEWRRKNRIDHIIEEYEIPEVGKYFPMSIIGFDKEGSPIIFLDVANMDLKGILKSAKRSNCLKSVLKHLEIYVHQMKERSLKINKPVEQWSYILEFDNYSLMQATHKPSLELIGELLSIYEANYPERLKNAIVINASIYFTILFTVVKPLLTGHTLQKVKIFGKDGWKNELLKFIDSEELPANFGGIKTDPNGDPRCPSLVNYGAVVPKHFYFRSPERRLAYQSGVTKYNVSRMSKINILLPVKEPDSHIEWEFETESGDIGFGLYFKESEDDDEQKAKVLIPKQRVEAHLYAEKGMYQCENLGTYILMFDNSYSWLSQKEIFCKTSVVLPDKKILQ